MEIASTILMLVIIMDPFGNMIIINSLLTKYSDKKKQQIIARESLIAFLILFICAFCGDKVLDFLNLEQPALRISGGIILFLVALGMVFPSKNVMPAEEIEDPLIVPIAMPCIAGPSTISIVFLLSHKSPETVYQTIAIGSLISFIILYFSPYIFKFLGKRGSVAIERLTGMLLIMISVQMLLTGFKSYFSHS